MKTIIHVNRGKIDSNRKHGRNDPVLTVKRGRTNRYAYRVEIHGPATIVADGGQLSCGARAWIETLAEVTVHGVRAGGTQQGKDAPE